MTLQKFGAKSKHRTFWTDKVKVLTSTVELAVTDSSAHNSRGLHPCRDRGQLMPCILQAAKFGPEYSSYALISAVFIKNRLPHSALDMTTFPPFTETRPNLPLFYNSKCLQVSFGEGK